MHLDAGSMISKKIIEAFFKVTNSIERSINDRAAGIEISVIDALLLIEIFHLMHQLNILRCLRNGTNVTRILFLASPDLPVDRGNVNYSSPRAFQ